jgi:hypothetical protein
MVFLGAWLVGSVALLVLGALQSTGDHIDEVGVTRFLCLCLLWPIAIPLAILKELVHTD